MKNFFSNVMLCIIISQATMAGSLVATELRWNWQTINAESQNFWQTITMPKDFTWGVADSAYQTEGPFIYDGNIVANNWTEWEKNHDCSPIGKACNRWELYKEDIKRLKDCGFTSYRFSIEWSKLEPRKGQFDARVMQHYSDVVDELLKNNIEPIICLFHHTWPTWFGDKGGFEKKENNNYFCRYATYVFNHLHTKVKKWMTFNEPTGYALEAYFRGHYPPGKKSLKLAGIVLKNFLDTHCSVYKQFKKIDDSVSIGYAKIVQHLDPYYSWHPIEKIVTLIFDHLMNDVDLEYFKTGTFAWGFKGINLVSNKKPTDAPNCLDFLGVNYYSHTVIKMHMRLHEPIAPTPRPDELLAHNGMTIYPEGLYRAIKKCSVLGKPMHIAENGVPDKDDLHKDLFIKKHLYAVQKAIQDGYDVRGYYYWTLMDNYEWNKASSKFGLYAVNVDTQERILRDGAKNFITFITKNRGYYE